VPYNSPDVSWIYVTHAGYAICFQWDLLVKRHTISYRCYRCVSLIIDRRILAIKGESPNYRKVILIIISPSSRSYVCERYYLPFIDATNDHRKCPTLRPPVFSAFDGLFPRSYTHTTRMRHIMDSRLCHHFKDMSRG